MLMFSTTLRHHHILKMVQYESVQLTPWLLNQVSNCHGIRNKHQISYKPYVPPCITDHDHKNMTLKRPMSPHLTIYAPTLTSMTSISQRITGIILASYALLLSGGTLFLSRGVDTYVSVIQSLDLSRPSIFILKMLLGAPFAFHYFNGIRFCAWNAGRWLSLREVFSTARKSWIAATVLALLFALL